MRRTKIFAKPKKIKDIDKCFFYHAIDLPGYGTVKGEWDLRRGVNRYLGDVNFENKRVLEIGTANGFLCFEMEKRGAEVIGYDLSKNHNWDIVPFAQYDHQKLYKERQKEIEKLNNAFWFCHRLLNSRARVVYGDVYHIPREIGKVDIVTYGSILLHLRDPFLALQQGLKFARETVIVTEILRDPSDGIKGPFIKFLPNAETLEPKAAWWDLKPPAIVRMLGVLGFEDVKVSIHTQEYNGEKKSLYTVVGHRTKGKAETGYGK